jgi:hypothetical protein
MQRAALVFASCRYAPIALYRLITLVRFWPVAGLTIEVACLEVALPIVSLAQLIQAEGLHGETCASLGSEATSAPWHAIECRARVEGWVFAACVSSLVRRSTARDLRRAHGARIYRSNALAVAQS